MAQPLIAGYHPLITDTRIHNNKNKEKCCAERKADKNKKSTGSCQCNSLASCCRLNYISASVFLFDASLAQIIKTTTLFHDYKIEAGYKSGSWHPPNLTLYRQHQYYLS
jgi:hypothetical protein